jgi:hypothetical protein
MGEDVGCLCSGGDQISIRVFWTEAVAEWSGWRGSCSLGKGKEEGRLGWSARSQDWGPASEEWRRSREWQWSE